mmetsp:Transcript_2042/g.5892  ORF Transcript_2042/g.5892 Transcript_2042/m.5892 type:complete len:247 (+) Transcript_2042:1375-2115(+)
MLQISRKRRWPFPSLDRAPRPHQQRCRWRSEPDRLRQRAPPVVFRASPGTAARPWNTRAFAVQRAVPGDPAEAHQRPPIDDGTLLGHWGCQGSCRGAAPWRAVDKHKQCQTHRNHQGEHRPDARQHLHPESGRLEDRYDSPRRLEHRPRSSAPCVLLSPIRGDVDAHPHRHTRPRRHTTPPHQSSRWRTASPRLVAGEALVAEVVLVVAEVQQAQVRALAAQVVEPPRERLLDHQPAVVPGHLAGP